MVYFEIFRGGLQGKLGGGEAGDGAGDGGSYFIMGRGTGKDPPPYPRPIAVPTHSWNLYIFLFSKKENY